MLQNGDLWKIDVSKWNRDKYQLSNVVVLLFLDLQVQKISSSLIGNIKSLTTVLEILWLIGEGSMNFCSCHNLQFTYADLLKYIQHLTVSTGSLQV